MGFGDDFRLMTRVLPRPLGLQGGKSFAKPTWIFSASEGYIKDLLYKTYGVFFYLFYLLWGVPQGEGRGRTLVMRRISSPVPFFMKVELS